MRRLLRTGHLVHREASDGPDPVLRGGARRDQACGEGLITNNALKTPLNIPFRNFRWSELQPLSVDSLQVAVYERMPPNVRSSEPVSSTDQLLPQVAVDQTVVKGPRGQTIGTLQRDGRTVVDSEDRVVGVWNADGALMAHRCRASMWRMWWPQTLLLS